MNPLATRTAVIIGALIGVLNIVFGSIEVGFRNLPAWFFALQLLLIPSMLVTLPLFARGAVTPGFAQRALTYAAGWALPYLIYKVSGDMLRPTFDPLNSLLNGLLFVLLFGVLFAALRRPQV